MLVVSAGIRYWQLMACVGCGVVTAVVGFAVTGSGFVTLSAWAVVDNIDNNVVVSRVLFISYIPCVH